MLDFFQKSLRNKLLVTFIFIGFLPFVTLLIYTIFLSESKIVNKIVNEQFDKTSSISQQINNKIDALTKEVKFMASIDVMDELLADDIDKKISRLLAQKSKDFNLKNNFFVLNKDATIVASSDMKNKLTKKNIEKIIKHTIYTDDKALYITQTIRASFGKHKTIGYLILEYSLENFDTFLLFNKDSITYLINPKQNYIIGHTANLHINFSKNENSSITSKHLIVYKKMDNILKDWYIVYSVEKSVALEFLYDFIRFMLYISIPIILLIIYVSIMYANEIVKPIEKLIFITDNITNTQNYSARLSINSKDEIATLSNSFNDMLKATSSAHSKLEEENRLRLKRFIQLIEVFNTIIQTKDEQECINTSMQQIKFLTDKSDLSFVKNRLSDVTRPHIPLYITDFEHNAKVYFGTIILGLDKFDDDNEQKFYNSIGAMITLQLDKIRLIDRTMSASRAKSAFISNMSHELRTPLNAIIGFSQYMITYEDLSDEQQDTMANIESSAHYLLEMINDILDIAKIEAGKMEAHLEKTDILNLVKTTYNMLQPLVNDKGLGFELKTDNFDNKSYITDPKMFQQIVINLISNAIKFTEKGTVSVELFTKNKQIFVTVKDSGIGISKEDIKQLFHDFTQVENIMQKKHKGTGLGLSLSKKIANILDGDISIESQGLEHGTIAIFSANI
ncbi:MAG: ATP-binding protein [Sulfurimonas sp.]